MKIKHQRESDLLPHYDRQLDYYSPVLKVVPSLIKAFGIDMGSVRRVLDVGCGDGRLALHLASEYGVEVEGVDYSSKRIDKAAESAARSGLNCKFYLCDLNYFVAECDRQYDLIALFEILEHLEEPACVVENCRRLLAPGGVAIGSIPIGMSFVSHLQVFSDARDVAHQLRPDRMFMVRRSLPHVHSFCLWTSHGESSLTAANDY